MIYAGTFRVFKFPDTIITQEWSIRVYIAYIPRVVIEFSRSILYLELLCYARKRNSSHSALNRENLANTLSIYMYLSRVIKSRGI